MTSCHDLPPYSAIFRPDPRNQIPICNPLASNSNKLDSNITYYNVYTSYCEPLTNLHTDDIFIQIFIFPLKFLHHLYIFARNTHFLHIFSKIRTQFICILLNVNSESESKLFTIPFFINDCNTLPSHNVVAVTPF